MANENPFDPKFGYGLLRFLDPGHPEKPKTPGIDGLLGALTSSTSAAPTTTPSIGGLLGALSPPSPPLGSLYGAASDLLGPSKGLTGCAVSDLLGSPPANPNSLGALGDLFATTPPSPFGALYAPPAPTPYTPPTPSKPKPVAPAVKRKAFFSFHYDDIMRVNVVRNAWRITHPDSALMRSFYDSSLWESKKLEGDEAVKRLIRDGVCNTSAVCVLSGSGTWERRWVRYEIARAVIDGRGLLTVYLNSIRHHVTRTPHVRGQNPLSFMAIGKVQDNALQPARYYLFEKRLIADGIGGWKRGWYRYDDYTLAVELPGWVRDPTPGFVTPLSDCADEYDYIADNGHRNIGSWIDRAAQRAGR